jgi:DNA helicase-2/ATP-dependent DNA helicase PcrA
VYYRNEKEGADRLENLDELVNAAAMFVEERATQMPAEGAPPEEEMDELTAFLAHAALEAGEHQAEVGSDALQLMTVHSAKGLEFHAVFITGLEEGLFPHENSMAEAEGVEEERRLMYVALTRARRRLYLLLAQSRMLHGQTRYNVPSRFFRELPEALLQRVNHTRPASGYAQQRTPSYGTPARSLSGQSTAPTLQSREFPWRIGQAVTHAKFGAGVIVNAEGAGADARVQVNFKDSGLKWLALAYARLEAA